MLAMRRKNQEPSELSAIDEATDSPGLDASLACDAPTSSTTKAHRTSLEIRRLQTQIHLDSGRILRAMERRIASLFAARDVGLTPAQGNVLVVLFHHKAPMTSVQVAQALGVSQATVARFIKVLTSQGWVERQRCPNDARAVLLRLTPKAYDHLPTMIAVSNTMLDEAFAGFSVPQIKRLAEMAERLRDNLDARNSADARREETSEPQRLPTLSERTPS